MKRESILLACAMLVTAGCAYQPYDPNNEDEYLDTFCDDKTHNISRIGNDDEDLYPGEEVPPERMAYCHNRIR